MGRVVFAESLTGMGAPFQGIPVERLYRGEGGRILSDLRHLPVPGYFQVPLYRVGVLMPQAIAFPALSNHPRA